MKEILIISGKGGAGKTSLCAAFAVLAGKSVLVDCDVDASDLHLLLKPEVRETHPFSPVSCRKWMCPGVRAAGYARICAGLERSVRIGPDSP